MSISFSCLYTRLVTLCLVFLAIPNSFQAQIITTVAGNGKYGYSGDGGPATAAELFPTNGVAVDPAGNLYVPSDSYNVIRKVDAAGKITTIAGTGIIGYSGDNGPAINAKLYHPTSIIADRKGNVIFADQVGQVLRKIDAAGIITTIAGVTAGKCVGDGGPMLLAQFMSISGLALDNAGNIFVSDQGCNTVRKINLQGVITTVAGSGARGFGGDGGPALAAKLDQPFQVGVDLAGNIFIPEGRNARVRKVDPAGIITTVAGSGQGGYSGNGGPALLAEFDRPAAVATDRAGNVYIADIYNNVVRKLDKNGIVTNYAGSKTPGYSGDGGPANRATLSLVEGICVDDFDNLYIADHYNYVIRKVTKCEIPVVSHQGQTIKVCEPGTATLTVKVTDASTFQWEINDGSGWKNLANDQTYSDVTQPTLLIKSIYNGMNGYAYRLHASSSCASKYSEPDTLAVNAAPAPQITVSISSATICANTPGIFTAKVVNSGALPIIQWFKNGNKTGAGIATYIDNQVSDGDVITCLLVSNTSCRIMDSAMSNTIVIKTFPAPVVTLDHSQTLCSLTTRTLDAGSFASYEWSTGSTERTLTINKPGSYAVKVLDGNGCIGRDTATITATVPNPSKFLPPDTSVCRPATLTLHAPLSAYKYHWSTGDQGASIIAAKTGLYTLEIEDSNHCKGADTINLVFNECKPGFYVPNAFSPNGDRRNDIFKPAIVGTVSRFEFVIFNRYGQIVFKTRDYRKGWDGSFSGKMQDPATFVWKCTFQLDNGLVQNKHGVFTLLR